MGEGKRRAERRRDFVLDDLAAYWPVYTAAFCFLVAFLYVVFVRHGSTQLAAVSGVLTLGCVLWPRSAGLRAKFFGGSEIAAPKKGAELDAPEVQTPDISAPLLPDDDPKEPTGEP